MKGKAKQVMFKKRLTETVQTSKTCKTSKLRISPGLITPINPSESVSTEPGAKRSLKKLLFNII